MTRETKIYVLVDPTTNEIRYVGKTVQKLSKRLANHISQSKKKITHKDCWISGLLSVGVEPTIRQIDTALEDWAEKEIFWIKHHKESGCKITNITDGGEGMLGIKTSNKTKSILSKIQSDLMTTERRLKIGVKVKESWTEERKKEWSDTAPERFTEEYRKKLSDKAKEPKRLKRHLATQDKYWTEEKRKEKAELVKSQMTDERRKSHSEKLKRTMADPEWKKMFSETQKKKWTPERRAAASQKTMDFNSRKRAMENQL